MPSKIQILQRGGVKNHEKLLEGAHFFLGELMSSRLANLLEIRIEVRSSKLENGTLACAWLPTNGSSASRSFTIVLHRERPLLHQLFDLAHELVHVAQAASGRLQYRRRKDGKTYVRWEGEDLGALQEIPYWDRPWEEEAHRMEEELFRKFAALWLG